VEGSEVNYRLIDPAPPASSRVVLDLAADPGLGRHVRDSAYWKRPVGTLITSKGPRGVHTDLPEVEDPTDLAKSVEAKVAKASGLKPGSPEHAKAWSDIAADVDALSAKAKAVAEGPVPGSWKAKAKTAQDVVGKKGSKGVVEHLTIGSALIPAIIAAGNKVTVAAGGLLTGGEGESFAHSFENIIHNPLVDASLWVALALILHTLAVRLKAGLKKRKAAKVEKAREEAGKA
jgi:hypothetical protein